MKILAFIILLQLAVSASAQNCTEALVFAKQGVWKPGTPGSQGGTASDLAKEKKLVETMHSMIKSKYVPMSVSALHYGVYNPPYSNTPANHYSYCIIPLNFYCDGDKINTAHETSSYFAINANFFDADIYSFHDNIEATSGTGYHYIRDMPIEKDGYWYFEEIDAGLGLGMKGKSRAWLITYNGKLPFAYVTKKEFLETRKKILENARLQSASGFKSSLDNIEIEKKYKEAEFKNDPVKLEHYMKMDYRQLKERYEKLLADNDKSYKPGFEKIEKQLQLPATELNQQAIVKQDPNDHLSYLFTDDKDPFGDVLIKPNPAYFNTKLPRSTPQFFWVYVRANHKEPIAARFMADVIKAIDFSSLKSMLGKEPVNTSVQNKIVSQPKPKPAKTETEPSEVNIYKNEVSPGFKPTPASQIKNVVQLPVAVNKAIKSRALALKLTTSSIPEYLNQLLVDVEKNLDPQQKKNTELLYSKMKGSVVELADAGVMLFYKGAVNEALWCLAKAASLQPKADYILSNLTAIMNLAQAEARALPILRLLKERHPTNSTVLNNLGQAFYALGELNSSEAALDSCLLFASFHPQANFTRAIIAEKKGKNAEAATFIQKSLKGAYSEKTDEFAKSKGIKLDYSNILNRFRPTSVEYINPIQFRPPAQCTNVFAAAESEAEWNEWTEAMQKVSSKINANLSVASSRYESQIKHQVQNKTSSAILSLGPLHSKAEKLYKIYMDKLAMVQEEAVTYLNLTYKKDQEFIEKEYSDKLKEIEKKYQSRGGEGKGSYTEERCAELNAAGNKYLENMAGINTAFNKRFAEPIRSLNIEMMYWSQMMAGPTGWREMVYYERAIFAVNPMQIKSVFVKPCQLTSTATAKEKDADLKEAYCPIHFKLKLPVIKLTGDCGKFEIEVEVEGLVLNFERDFANKKSTIAFGAGLSLDLQNKIDEVSQNVIVPTEIAEFVEFGGGGVGTKVQGFIEIGPDGISDLGLRGEASIEGVASDVGDIKINGKIGVNSGVEITTSPAVENIGKSLNEFFAK